MMIGIAIGLMVVAGASFMMLTQLSEHRRLSLETQVQQDLRAAAALMQQEVRHAGFWAAADRGVRTLDAPPPQASPYAIDRPCGLAASPTQFAYAYSSHATDYLTDVGEAIGTKENDVLDSDEIFGFRVSNKALQFMFGCPDGQARWQPLTDLATLKIVTPTSFDVAVDTIDLSAICARPCPAAGGNCPRAHVRRIHITLTGEAAHDASVKRTVQVFSRQRNDRIEGACPT
ncbi:MAG: hypothetical protein JO369_04705 [Paucibacter sp.]|nr:hypothetical protein [Roseateles sp.]